MNGYLAYAFAIALTTVLGVLWYSRFLFGRGTAHVRFTPVRILMLLVSLILLSLAIPKLINNYVSSTFEAMGAAIFIWILIVLPVAFAPVLFEGKPLRSFWVSAFYYLVCVLIMSAVLFHSDFLFL